MSEKENKTTSALGAAGAGVAARLAEADGSTNDYFFSTITQGMQDSYSSWILSRAREAALQSERFYRKKVRELRKRLSDENDFMDDVERLDLIADIRELEYSADRQMSDVNARNTAGHYYYHGEVCQEARTTFEGSVKLLWMMLQPKQKGLLLEKVEKLCLNNQKKIRETYDEVLGLGKPNPRRPDDGGGSSSETPSSTDTMSPSTPENLPLQSAASTPS